jgi:biotin transporter BioY
LGYQRRFNFGVGGFAIRFPAELEEAIIVDVTMNAASAALGAFLLPAAGFLWEFFPGQLYMGWLHMGTFNPITWAATCIIAVFLSTGIESAVVRVLFGYELTKRRFWSVALANLLSTAIAFCSLLIHPPQF